MAHYPFIKKDKLGRICSIVWSDSNSSVTPEEFKPALNMFQGRQFKTALSECKEYIKLTLRQQAGEDVSEELYNIHRSWNERS